MIYAPAWYMESTREQLAELRAIEEAERQAQEDLEKERQKWQEGKVCKYLKEK